MKVLNLYACLGGNRYKWTDCEVTAVELDPELARMYQERFPNDTVVISDAHQYLLDHYKEFDFIWSSPPCPTHSRARYWASKGGRYDVDYPDMKLYQEIIFLQHFFDGKWVVENVDPYYAPIIPATKIGRHLFWSNFNIAAVEAKDANIHEGNIKQWQEFHEIDISEYKGSQRKDKILRNLVRYDIGKSIFNQARDIIEKSNTQQTTMFDENT